jgi:hypothetical protein
MRVTLKMLEAAVSRLNTASGFNAETAARFNGHVCGKGYGLDVQNLRAAGDRHNRYQLRYYDGLTSGCADVTCSYSLTCSELYEKVQCMSAALRILDRAAGKVG